MQDIAMNNLTLLELPPEALEAIANFKIPPHATRIENRVAKIGEKEWYAIEYDRAVWLETTYIEEANGTVYCVVDENNNAWLVPSPERDELGYLYVFNYRGEGKNIWACCVKWEPTVFDLNEILTLERENNNK